MEKKMFACNWDQYDADIKRDVWQMLEHKKYHEKTKKSNNEK